MTYNNSILYHSDSKTIMEVSAFNSQKQLFSYKRCPYRFVDVVSANTALYNDIVLIIDSNYCPSVH